MTTLAKDAPWVVRKLEVRHPLLGQSLIQLLLKPF